jgi:hypothetical protein
VPPPQLRRTSSAGRLGVQRPAQQNGALETRIHVELGQARTAARHGGGIVRCARWVRGGRQRTLSNAEEKVRVWHEGEGEHKQRTVHKQDARWPSQHDQPVGSNVLRRRRAFRQRLGRFTPQPIATVAAAAAVTARLCSRWMAGEAPRGEGWGCGRGNPRGRVGAQKHNRRASVADGVHDTNTRTTRARAHTTSEALSGARWVAYWSGGAGRKRGAQRTLPLTRQQESVVTHRRKHLCARVTAPPRARRGCLAPTRAADLEHEHEGWPAVSVLPAAGAVGVRVGGCVCVCGGAEGRGL